MLHRPIETALFIRTYLLTINGYQHVWLFCESEILRFEVSEPHIRMGGIVQTHMGSFLCEVIAIKEANDGNRNRSGNHHKARF